MDVNVCLPKGSAQKKSITGEAAVLTTHRAPLPALTGIRFFAAFYVVLFHSKSDLFLFQHGDFALGHLIQNGQLAVPLFFILSGFILAYTYNGQIAEFHGKRRFWEARFARVWPLYALSLLLITLTRLRVPSLATAAATIFMVQAWDPFNVGLGGAWNPVCWTLSTEALFYLLFPFIQRWLERQSRFLQIAILLCSVAVALYFATGSITYSDNHGYRDIPLAALHLPEFLTGVSSGNLFIGLRATKRSGTVRPSEARGFGFLTWAALFSSILFLCQANRDHASWAVGTFTLLVFALAFESSLLQRLLSARVLLVGGQISYGIYLLQWPCKDLVNHVCSHVRISSALIRFVIASALLVVISAVAFYGVEEPLRRKLRAGFLHFEGLNARSTSRTSNV